jgi:PHD/YefM family antitoxin component YafN of YafNO toxin-antitoxin module
MITYASNELIPSSDFAKKFGTYLALVKENLIDKLAILKNNKVEAVLVSKDEYEKMKEALEYVEYKEIYNTIKQRKSKSYNTVSFEDMAKKHSIDV